jgi:hypothetical protein
VNDLPKTTPKALTNVKVQDDDDIEDNSNAYDDDQIKDETPVRDHDFIEDNYDDDTGEKPYNQHIEVGDVDEGIDMDYSQT